MKMVKTCLLLIGLVFFSLLGEAPAAEEQFSPIHKIGFAQRAFIPPEPYNWRGAENRALMSAIWYPGDPNAVEQPQWIGSPDFHFASAGRAAPKASVLAVPHRFPLIVLSHGTGGSAMMMAWLGTQLAAHGFIAVAVNHPGNNALEKHTVEGFTLWWERAKDLSTVIDQMLVDPVFGDRIDPKRIGAAGFSLGGYTMIEIAGGISTPSRFRDFCGSSQADRMCAAIPEFPDLRAKAEALAKSDKQFSAAVGQAGNSYRDPRVRAVFAIAPALGPAFDPKSLEGIAIPVEIVAGLADSIVPVTSSAKYFAAHIPGSKMTLLPDVGHYTFLASCTEMGQRLKPEVCMDRPGVDRDQVHRTTAILATKFFLSNIK